MTMRPKKTKRCLRLPALLTLLTLLTHSQTALAGPYHFSDVLIGDRAMALGGAFVGVADDSSGLYYNPAGLGFSVSSNLSAAVNAFQYSRREFKNVFAGKDSFYEDSQDVIPSYTGGVIELSKLSDGLRGAFSLQNLTQQSANQNDFIRRPDISVEYLHRTQKSQTSELVFSMGAGKRISANTSLGLSLGGHQLTFDSQEFQDVTTKAAPRFIKLTDAIAANKSLYLGRTRNLRSSARALSAELGAGLMWAPVSWLSFGFAVHTNFLIKQSQNTELDELAIFHYNDLSLPSAGDFESLPNAKSENAQEEIDTYSNKTLERTTSNNEPTNLKLKNAPVSLSSSNKMQIGRTRFRGGVALFPSPNFMMTLDLAGYHTETEWIRSENMITEFVLNGHLGLEYFFTPRLFIRQGLFTNFDARPEVSAKGNFERVDFAGTSLFLGTQTSDSQFSIGGIYQYGWGEALKLEGQSKPSPVRENKVLLAFTASHGL